MATSIGPVTARLDYAKRPSLKRRRWLAGFVALAILAASMVGWRWGGNWFDKGVMLYRQHRCLTYAAPADRVVFDSNPQRVQALAADRSYAIVRGCAFWKPLSYWDQYFGSLKFVASPSGSQRALLFLHECRSPEGGRFLVELERVVGKEESPDFIQGYDVECNVIQVGTLSSPPRQILYPYEIDVLDSIGPHTDIRIYAGQIDPSDPAHFTIRYESGGKSATINGRVDNEGHVTLARPEK